MILTRLILNARHPVAARDAAVPYEMHRTLARCFPEGPSLPVTGETKQESRPGYRAAYDVLFRVESAPAGPTRMVLVQSTVPLRVEALPPGYLVGAEHKEFAPEVVEGQTLGFRLLANPVLRESRKPGETGKHSRRRALPLTGEAYGTSPALDWLERQGMRCGFKPMQVSMQAVAPPSLSVAHGKGAVAHQGILYDGRLVVTDAAWFIRALRKGIGPAKAFGFGLLSVAP
ncbi:MAG: type I-E CRISPR-associated protein Cas6/Cse3/CasE [Bacteroidetes bacterium]|nr:type I-E CRISPR-associated protein Cas6/Cse3/CasE [Bacteroidota bacterium]